MRTVVKSTQVAHLWANENQGHARSGNVFFEGPTIYSYGHHFPMAHILHVKGKRLFIVTLDGYSATTSKHQSYVRGAIPASDPVVYVKGSPRKTVSEVLRSMEKHIKEEQRALKTMPRNIGRARRTIDLANRRAEYHRIVDLAGSKRRVLPPIDLSDQAWAEEYTQAHYDRVSQRRAKRCAAMEAFRKKQDEEYAVAKRMIAENPDAIRTHYHEHGRVPEPLNFWKWDVSDALGDLLRIEGDRVTTSKGAEVPVSAVRRVWPLFVAALKDGKPVAGMSVGPFEISEMNGTKLTVGCHNIQWPEVRWLEKTLQLSPALP